MESHQAQEALNQLQKHYYCVYNISLAMSVEVPIACPIVRVDADPETLRDVMRAVRMAED
jgi:hypothetical protein